MMTFDKWVNYYQGKYIDFDKVYGVQCVDLVKHYVKNVLDVEPQSIGNAIEYYNKRNTSRYLKNNFIWIANTPEFIPQKGDVCVFTSKSGFGHVAIASGEGTTKYFYSYDENYPKGKGEPMTKIKHTYTSFLGVLRPKNQIALQEKIYKTTIENLNAYSTNKFSSVAIVLPKGSKVELVSQNGGKMNKNGKIYNMSIIRYKTILYYVASYYLK